jgi:hypothetical protein
MTGVLPITRVGSLGCAAAAQPRVHPSGPDGPRARSDTAIVKTADGGCAFQDRAVRLEERAGVLTA